jgi:hypothetical protein
MFSGNAAIAEAYPFTGFARHADSKQHAHGAIGFNCLTENGCAYRTIPKMKAMEFALIASSFIFLTIGQNIKTD